MSFHIVVWKDAVSVDCWTDESEIEPTYHTIESAGMLVKEDEETLVLGLNQDLDSGNWSCFIHIPKGLILSHEILNTDSSSSRMRVKRKTSKRRLGNILPQREK